LKHFADDEFWARYAALPKSARRQADKSYALLKANPFHPSLHFKQVGRLWSARIGISDRALAVQTGDDYVWYWIGPHSEYNRLIK
jgi:hypothetical protein